MAEATGRSDSDVCKEVGLHVYSHQWTPIVQERASSEHERVTLWHFSNEASDANYPIEDIEGYWRHQKTSKKASSQPEAHVLHFVPSLQYRDEHVLERIERVVYHSHFWWHSSTVSIIIVMCTCVYIYIIHTIVHLVLEKVMYLHYSCHYHCCHHCHGCDGQTPSWPGPGRIIEEIIVMVCHGMSWYVMVCHGMSWYVMVCHGMSWYVMVCHGMSWYVMVCHGMSWYVMVCHGMSWLHTKVIQTCSDHIRPSKQLLSWESIDLQAQQRLDAQPARSQSQWKRFFESELIQSLDWLFREKYGKMQGPSYFMVSLHDFTCKDHSFLFWCSKKQCNDTIIWKCGNTKKNTGFPMATPKSIEKSY